MFIKGSQSKAYQELSAQDRYRDHFYRAARAKQRQRFLDAFHANYMKALRAQMDTISRVRIEEANRRQLDLLHEHL